MNSTIKPKIGICIDCPPGSKPKHIISDRCADFHYKKHRAEVNKSKAEERQKLNDFLGNPTIEQKTRKPIPKVSAKRKIENREYTIKRLQFLSQPENQRCFIDGCNNRADTIEHSHGRIGKNFLDVSTWRPCCNYHNLELERNSELSEKYQVSKISGKQKIVKR